MLIIRCKSCNKQLTSTVKLKTCGCSNQTTIRGGVVSANDLNKVEIVQGYCKSKNTEYNGLSSIDLSWQEQRRKRGVKKLDFDVR